MTIFQARAYLRYLYAARGRHGTHSPFVYEFVEQVVQGHSHQPFNTATFAGNKYDALLARVAAYYGYKGVIELSTAEDHCEPLHINILSVNTPECWVREVQKNQVNIGSAGLVVAPGIYIDGRHHRQWQALIAEPSVTMSLDLYGMGLLLFRREFLVKQHFIIKY